MALKSLFSFLFFLTMASFSYGQTVHTLPLNEFVNQCNKTEKKVLLDVRTPEEWGKGKINSSKCISIKDANFISEVNKLDKNTPVFVYCAAGVRSASAAKKLQELGFKTIFNLSAAGYTDLAAKGLK